MQNYLQFADPAIAMMRMAPAMPGVPMDQFGKESMTE
jgi:hypothetical protein